MTSCVACSASLYEAGTKKCQRDFSVNRELQKINLKKKRLEVEEEKEEGKKKLNCILEIHRDISIELL